jgi:hypothetical protein
VAEFEEVNETRAECIRVLRRAFGPRFLGGLSRSPFALRSYPDVVVPESFDTSKRGYFRVLEDFPICVATTGLHGSIGWKFGEYVALGKAILSEPLLYRVPGPMAAERNYLEFRTPTECVQRAGEYFDSASSRRETMEANAAYGRDWVLPEALVWRAMESIFTER